MSIDIEQFQSTFFDESSDHLQVMEQELLNLNIAQPDAEQLNTIFRAAHSIKGGAGIFGFDALTGLTHVMENLLDEARHQRIHLGQAEIDLLLNTVDVLKAILHAYRTAAPLPEQDIAQSITALEQVLPDQAATNTPDDTDEDFGFFVEIPAAPADPDPGFGFFDEPEASPEATTVITPDHPPQAAASPARSTTEHSSIRVDTHKIDAMVNLVGELVITQSMLSMLGEQVDGAQGAKLQTAIAELQRNTREIQESAMAMRMLPINITFNRFPRVVRDLSQRLNKKVNLVLEGGATEIDKCMIEKLVDPLTHLVRNSIDHGIESPQTRQAAGKRETGCVILRAEQKGGNIVISIIDDGAGLDRTRILQKAAENGLHVAADLADAEVWQLIFQPGFSTAAEVTDVSGRGVGMDVVKRNIEALGGRIEIESSAGAGSAFHIQLPLTLAIVDGINVAIADEVFVVPLVNIVESIQPVASQIKYIGQDPLLHIRDQYWPLIALHQMMGIEDAVTDPAQGIVVLLESTKQRYGILVDGLLGQQQVVIKSLEQHYKKVPGISGATIMGDGRVAMILDADAIASHCQPIEHEDMRA